MNPFIDSLALEGAECSSALRLGVMIGSIPLVLHGLRIETFPRRVARKAQYERSRAKAEESSEKLASVIFLKILIPLASGALIRRFAQRIQPILARLGNLLLFAIALSILYHLWRPMLSEIGGGTLVSLLAFFIVGLVSGHLLGGPNPDDHTVLALASASQHLGTSMALARLNFPNGPHPT